MGPPPLAVVLGACISPPACLIAYCSMPRICCILCAAVSASSPHHLHPRLSASRPMSPQDPLHQPRDIANMLETETIKSYCKYQLAFGNWKTPPCIDGLKFRGGRVKCFLREDLCTEKSDKARRYRYTDSEEYCVHFQVGQVIEWVPKQRNLPEWLKSSPRRKEAEEVVNLNGGFKQTCQCCKMIGDHHPEGSRAKAKVPLINRKMEEQQIRPHRAPGIDEAAY
ncbi:hypothetical protein BDZ91DRAFT_845533 [Kalaharituber pfeilii]|nr:hypothetical protein BDZ91DRAFT_845533 [Kalaharituber pfeilii]